MENPSGRALPCPPRLARLYGCLRTAVPRRRAHVISNFVTSLDGVVSLQERGHDGGSDISGHDLQDRMVMGLLRAVCDVVLIGAGTLQADPDHFWTPEDVCPELADDYGRLRRSLGKPRAPLLVVVTGSGEIDLSLPVFSSNLVRTLILTTHAGMRRLVERTVPKLHQVQALGGRRSAIKPALILKAIQQLGLGNQILLEGGPRLLGDFYAARLVDEQFLTLSPQVLGRMHDDQRLSLVMGQGFAPGHGRWADLTDVRQGKNLLFLRYRFATGGRKTHRSG